MDEGYEDGFFSFQQMLQAEEEFEEMLSQELTAQQHEQQHAKPPWTNLTAEKRRQILDNLLTMETSQQLPYKSQAQLAREMGVHRSTINRIYKQMCTQRNEGVVIDVRPKKSGRCGRKFKEYSDAFLQSVPLQYRTTVRSFAKHLKVSHTTVHRLLKRGRLRSHTSANHPKLTDKHKIARLKWCLSNIIPGTPTQKATFNDMFNTLHTDEKWFYLNPDNRKFYLLPKEDDPYRCEVSKRFKIKVMFMAVIGRPMYDDHGGLIHDGKYGIFPFIFYKKAAKNSKNRAAGTWEVKAQQSVTREVIRDMLITKIIPCVKQKWPQQYGKEIFIQWDNARPHKVPFDEEWMEATQGDGWNIQMIFQPAQSPDLNVLDLGLFSSIQSIQYQSFPRNIEELIIEVDKAYDTFEPDTNKYTWLTLQSCMIEIVKERGGNSYKITHNDKRGLDELGILPENMEFDQKYVDDAVKYMNEMIRETNSIQGEDDEAFGEVDAD